MFQQEEEEKMNYFNSDGLKTTIATQVDYVELIVSRNTEDWRYQTKPLPQIKDVPKAETIKEEIHIEDELIDEKPIASRRMYTVQSQSHSISNSANPLAMSNLFKKIQ